MTSEDFSPLFLAHLAGYVTDDKRILRLCQSIGTYIALNDPTNALKALESIKNTYRAGISLSLAGPDNEKGGNMLPEVAEIIMSNLRDFPADLIHLAEAKCKSEIADKIVPVIRIAEAANWRLT